MKTAAVDAAVEAVDMAADVADVDIAADAADVDMAADVVAVDMDAAAVDAAAEAVDADELVAMLQAATAIPSITPYEGDFARWVYEQLGFDCWDHIELVDISEGRPNVYSSVGGASGELGEGGGGDSQPCKGSSLALAGHLDTVHTDDWIEHWAGTDRADPFAATVVDGEMWGRGVADQKAGICSIISALRAIRRADYRPKARVTGLFVCDEESGQPDSGVSAGMQAALRHGVLDASEPPEFLIYTEPTTSAIYTAQMGFLIANVTLTGRSAYFGRPELGIDALRAGHDLLEALWAHSDQLKQQGSHELIGEAFLLVTKVSSGGNIAVPGQFDLSLIRKILPTESLDAAADSIRTITANVAKQHGVEAVVEFPASRDHPVGGTPDEIPADHPGVVSLGRSITTVTGEPARIAGAPFWSEKPFLAQLGVPGVYFAPGDISDCHTPFERVSIDELISATRALTHFIGSWCGLEKISPQKLPER